MNCMLKNDETSQIPHSLETTHALETITQAAEGGDFYVKTHESSIKNDGF